MRRSIRDGNFNHYYLKVPHRTRFNTEALKYYQIHLCESVIDTLTLYSNGIENACGVYGTNSLKDDTIKKIASSQVEDVVIAYDNDKAGNEAAHLAAKKLKKENIRSQRFKLPAGYDVNQYLTNP